MVILINNLFCYLEKLCQYSSTIYCLLCWMWNLYCLFEFINSSFTCVQVSHWQLSIQACLTMQLTALFLLHYRKRVFNQDAHFIHINLSAALLIGLIVFVSGIEAAFDSRVRSDVINLMHECTMDSGKRTYFTHLIRRYKSHRDGMQIFESLGMTNNTLLVILQLF